MNQTDHHFSKKLRDLEIAPSERANELFRSRLEQLSPQEEKPWKYFATAASVLLALGVLLFLHLNKNVMTTDTALVLPKPAEESTSAGVEKEPVTTEEPAVTGEAPSRPAPASEPKRMPVLKASESVAVSRNATEKENNPGTEMSFRKNLSDLQSLSPEISYRYHSTDLTDFAILDAHSRLELNALETSSKEASEPTMPLLAKVVREVKYVANGEKPDLDRSGIKPAATVLAHNQNGLLANESRQIKEGFHRFKEIFR